MNHFFHKKVLTPFQAVLLAAACIMGTAACIMGMAVCIRGTAVCITGTADRVPANAALFPFGAAESRAQPKDSDGRSLERIYREAVIDAVSAEEEELFPLVTITEGSEEVSWKDGKILLVTLNDAPELYEQGKTVVLPGEVWTFTDREIGKWYQDHKDGVTDWNLRLFQLIGVPPDAGYTHATAMWVYPEDVIRPAYRTDISDGAMVTCMLDDMPEEYRKWFNGNIVWSYFDSDYPWTRLGYTYDWAPGSGEYGLTEFLIRPESEVQIEYTEPISRFVERLESVSK